MVNEADILKKLLLRGYVIVETEKLDFLQQVKLFINAKDIVAPTGAALANAIFCKPGTRIGVLMGKHPEMIYRYWLNMLTPFGIKVICILGEIVSNRHFGLHGDYFVEPSDLDLFLNQGL